MSSLYTMRWPALRPSVELELVLIHGWGMSAAIWQSWLPLLRSFAHVTVVDLPGFGRSQQTHFDDIDRCCEALASQLPERGVLLGWSLGGMVAAELIRREPQRWQALITIASNPKYVADSEWPTAMPAETFAAFYAGVEANAGVALRRFLALQVRGSENEKTVLKQLRESQEPATDEALLLGLQQLQRLDTRSLLAELAQPQLHILGAADQLVPASVADRLPGEVELIEGAAHLPFLSHPEQSVQRLQQFLHAHQLADAESTLLRDKRAVARSFSSAASSYDSVAQLQRDIGQALLPEAPIVGDILDLGCGTGYFSEQLGQYGDGAVWGLDLAEGMIRYAREQRGTLSGGWLCGDAEALPLASESMGMIFSSLAIQWCENLPQLFAEAERVLQPGGRLLIATLGPQTLHELREAWREVDSYVHVNQFPDRATLQAAIATTDLELCEFREEMITLKYEKLQGLTRELKGIGAHNVNPGRPEGLTGRARIRALQQAYEPFRDTQGLLPASYQVWWLELRRAA